MQLDILKIFEQRAQDGPSLEEAGVRSRCWPPVEVTDKILRYEAHLDRQLDRAMDQRERLQGQCKGEIVPPPLNVNLGRRG